MPRELGDVLHYFIPESGQPETLPLRLTLLITDTDVVRSALAWNLAVELTGQGLTARVLAAKQDESSALWPQSAEGPLSVPIELLPASPLGPFASEVQRACSSLPAEDLCVVRIPPCWLLGPWPSPPEQGAQERAAVQLLDWVLLFATPERNDLIETYGLMKLIRRINPQSNIAVALHGAADDPMSHRAFEKLDGAATRHLGTGIGARGVLRDDLNLYRAIVTERPVGLAHPQSPVAKALREFATTLREAAEAKLRG